VTDEARNTRLSLDTRLPSRAEPGFARAEPKDGGKRRAAEGGGPWGNHGFPHVRASAASTARLNEPRRALVEERFDGTPQRVNRQPVELVREEWRVVDRWWTEEPVARRYFEVVLESGQNVVVFRDEERGGWFSQRGA